MLHLGLLADKNFLISCSSLSFVLLLDIPYFLEFSPDLEKPGSTYHPN